MLRRRSTNTPVRALAIEDADIGYGQMTVLRGVGFTIGAGECVGVLGPNGVGKTTLLSCLAGVRGPGRGSVIGLTGDGERVDLTRTGPEARRFAGISFVPEGRRIFPRLTVAETLRFAHEALHRPRAAADEAIEEVYTRFPGLAGRRHVAAGMLSGGEQQMLSLARAMAGGPSVLLVDEPFMGLAPKVVDELIEYFRELRATGVTLVVADESATTIDQLTPERTLDVRDLSAPVGA
ncbi:ABC transporter ATP-binding protein [Amycolatopsis eburnea]|uniref:ATP-binding cassette domain-containing protein n=1 Tax=Amycolatopsis eburnea TaxID=2267691 RepID=A0A427T1U3_9PSEU|nr:ATP-binding cassette domain-containing protein [Amycolatopsis eburnea]RSD11716.1 ATP-binding cassette domain-containing protein [Amycolatopsis eburnea]